MLVLSRKVGESIFINESIRVTVVQASNGRIRLGIDAPPEVKVLREELTMPSFYSPPSKNGKVEALPAAALLIAVGKEAIIAGQYVHHFA